MAYDVTSWFIDQLALKHSSPKRQLLLGGSDYSSRVLRWPTIRRGWNEVRPQAIVIELANEDGALNILRQDKTQLTKSAYVKFGFTHPTSGDELITMYSGKISRLKFSDGSVSVSLLDKFKQLSERTMGTNDAPATFTSSSTPTDIIWAAVTSYGGYSAVTSTSNPDINYQSFLDLAAVFSLDNVFMNGHIIGKKCTDVLKRISRYTETAIFIENDKLTFKRFTANDSNSTTVADPISVTLEVDDEDIINRQYVYGGYDITSRDWFVQVSDTATASVNSFGLREQVEKDDSIWYVNSASALNLAQRITFFAPTPYDKLQILSTLQPVVRQVGETISVVDSFHGIDSRYRIMDYSFNMDNGTYEASVNRSRFLPMFILDVSFLDGEDLLL